MAAGDLVLSTAEKAALLVRLQPTTLKGGNFSTPSERETEIARVLRATVSAVAATG